MGAGNIIAWIPVVRYQVSELPAPVFLSSQRTVEEFSLQKNLLSVM